MEPVEYDVYVGCRDESSADLARLVAAGLKRRGFRVHIGRRDPGADAAENLKVVEDAPDFVALLTPGSLDAGEGDNPMRAELAHARRYDRNIVPVVVPGFVRPRAGALPPDLATLPWREAVSYDPLASHESVARIAHMLASDSSVDDRRLMRQAKRLFLTLGVALLAVGAIEVARALPKILARPPIDVRPLAPLSLYWSGFGQRLTNGQWVEFALEDGCQLFAGDQVKVAFTPSADGYGYVVTRDLRGEIAVLFPARALRANSRVRAGELQVAPFDGSWFAIGDPAGVQAIYVLVSYDPIENLESLVEERDEEASVQARLFLLDSTISGLLDGRHGQAGVGVRTRSGRPIVQNVDVPAGPRTAETALTSGLVAVHQLATQPGLVSAVAEIRIRYQPTR